MSFFVPILAMENPLEDVLPHALFYLGPVPVTNQMFMALAAAVLMLLLFPWLFRKPDSGAPTGVRNFFESILEFLRVEVFRPALKDNTDRFLPFLWSLFFFILLCNLLGDIPFASFVALITGRHIVHLGGSATGNISTTAALAICAFFFIHIYGLSFVARSLMDGTYGRHEPHEEHSSDGGKGREAAMDLEHFRGEALPVDAPQNFDALRDPVAHYADDQHLSRGDHARHPALHAPSAGMPVAKAWLLAIPIYLWNFAPHPFRPPEGSNWVKWLPDIGIFIPLLLLEMLGALIKPFALCMRLFANMVSGHVMLAVVIGLITAAPSLILQFSIGIPLGVLDIGIQLLEIFVAFLQAYIFTFLTTLFLASAIAPEH